MAGRGGLVAEPKIAGSLTQSSQRKTMQAASSQLIKKLSTTRLKRSVSFGQEKKNPQWRRFIRRQGKARGPSCSISISRSDCHDEESSQ